MNRAQKRILKISLILTILIFLFPPWIEFYGAGPHSQGWHFVFSHPVGIFEILSIDLYMIIFQFLVLYTVTFLLYKIYEGPNDKEKKQ